MTSIREAYAKATHATHLRTTADKRGATDYLIASAWTPTRMGSLLRRLQGEWDVSAKKLRMSEADYTLLMSSLKTLPATIRAIEAWCERKEIPDGASVARKALHWWLDNTCLPCAGRGQVQIPHTPALGDTCKHCRGTGKRREPQEAWSVLEMISACLGKDVAKMREYLRDEL